MTQDPVGPEELVRFQTWLAKPELQLSHATQVNYLSSIRKAHGQVDLSLEVAVTTYVAELSLPMFVRLRAAWSWWRRFQEFEGRQAPVVESLQPGRRGRKPRSEGPDLHVERGGGSSVAKPPEREKEATPAPEVSSSLQVVPPDEAGS